MVRQSRSYLKAKNLHNISPGRVFNGDESAFLMVPKAQPVLVRKGTRTVYQIVDGKEKANFTVFLMYSADGELALPLVVFEGKKLPRKSILEQIPSGWSVSATENGWMTKESFFYYFKEVFHKWLIEKKIDFPVIVYLDGHISYLSIALLEYCLENRIELTALYPNSTHILQPLDVAQFHPLKEAYRKEVKLWKAEFGSFKKDNFSKVLMKAINTLDIKKIIKNGFRSCGLYPFNANAVDYNILNKKKKVL